MISGLGWLLCSIGVIVILVATAGLARLADALLRSKNYFQLIVIYRIFSFIPNIQRALIY